MDPYRSRRYPQTAEDDVDVGFLARWGTWLLTLAAVLTVLGLAVAIFVLSRDTNNVVDKLNAVQAPTAHPTPSSAPTLYPSFSATPSPSPTCNCCALCGTDRAYECACCHYCDVCDCCGQTSLALEDVTRNIVIKSESGNNIPPDTTMAVGNDVDGGRIVVAVQREVLILNKKTHTRLMAVPAFWSNGTLAASEPYVTWDSIHERFFLTASQVNSCAKGVVVLPPSPVAREPCTTRASFGPVTFDVTGNVSITSPLDGCAAITTNLTGLIALIPRGVCGFTVKVKNAQNAGAIGVIVYNNAGDALLNMGGVDPSIVIGSRFIGQTDGTAIATNLPLDARILAPVNTSFTTTMYIAVSKTAAPSAVSDFWFYTVTDGAYNQTSARTPAHSTDVNAFYISTQNFGDLNVGRPVYELCLGAGIRAFNKAALMAGSGALTLWQQTVVGPQFLFPTEVRTPIADQQQSMFFVGTNVRFDCTVGGLTQPSSLVIYSGSSSGLSLSPATVPFPTPMTVGVCLDADCLQTLIPGMRQPPPAIPSVLNSMAGTMMTGVVYRDQLYTAFTHNVSATHVVVRWFGIDVSKVIESATATLTQWSDLNEGADVDSAIPHVDVTRDEVVGIGFYASGPSLPVAARYTVHFPGSALGSVEYPFHVAVPNNYTYYEDTGSGNRNGEYIGLQVDPVDRETFYGFTQRPYTRGIFNPPNIFGPCNQTLFNCTARDWTTDLWTFRALVDTCPSDGIQTQPMAVTAPSTEPQSSVTQEPSSFELLVPPQLSGRPDDESPSAEM